MIISISLAMLFELVRTRDVKTVFDSIKVFFDGMGKIFATVITLIVAGETLLLPAATRDVKLLPSPKATLLEVYT